MKVRVSKVFAAYINKTAKALGFKCCASVENVNERFYQYYVDNDVFRADDYGDYDYGTGEYKVIKLEYPCGYCAMPRYLTTHYLTKMFNHYNVSDEDGLMRMIRDICEI